MTANELGRLTALLPEVFFQGLTKHVGFHSSSLQLLQPPPRLHLGHPETVLGILFLSQGDALGDDALAHGIPALADSCDEFRSERPFVEGFPKPQVVEVDGVFLYVLHDVNELDLNPAAANFHVVVSGHSHRPSVTQERGILFPNPGSAGRRRFGLPVTVARLVVQAGQPYAEIIELPA